MLDRIITQNQLGANPHLIYLGQKLIVPIQRHGDTPELTVQESSQERKNSIVEETRDPSSVPLESLDQVTLTLGVSSFDLAGKQTLPESKGNLFSPATLDFGVEYRTVSSESISWSLGGLGTYFNFSKPVDRELKHESRIFFSKYLNLNYTTGSIGTASVGAHFKQHPFYYASSTTELTVDSFELRGLHSCYEFNLPNDLSFAAGFDYFPLSNMKVFNFKSAHSWSLQLNCQSTRFESFQLYLGFSRASIKTDTLYFTSEQTSIGLRGIF